MRHGGSRHGVRCVRVRVRQTHVTSAVAGEQRNLRARAGVRRRGRLRERRGGGRGRGRVERRLRAGWTVPMERRRRGVVPGTLDDRRHSWVLRRRRRGLRRVSSKRTARGREGRARAGPRRGRHQLGRVTGGARCGGIRRCGEQHEVGREGRVEVGLRCRRMPVEKWGLGKPWLLVIRGERRGSRRGGSGVECVGRVMRNGVGAGRSW